MKRRAVKFALGLAMAFGVFKGAEAAFSPAPKPLAPVFNPAAAQLADAQQIREYRLPSLVLPDNADEIWRVRLGAWEMSAGGHHTFLEFGPMNARSPDDVYQIQGIAMDAKRRSYALLDFLNPGAYTRYFKGDYVLKAFGVNHDHNRLVFHKEPAAYVDVFYGSKDEVLKMYLDAIILAEDINRRADIYDLLDHNSNSVQRTLLDGLGIETPGLYAPLRLNALGERIWTPGLELSLLPKDWDRQKAREQGGYGKLSGEALEKAAREASRGADSVWSVDRRSSGPKGPA
jgi:hypothetical protein